MMILKENIVSCSTGGLNNAGNGVKHCFAFIQGGAVIDAQIFGAWSYKFFN